MRDWKRFVGLTAMFVAIGFVAFAAAAAREGKPAGERARGAGAGAGAAVEIGKPAATIAATAVAKELALNDEQTKKFVDAYVAELLAGEKRMTDVRASGERGKTGEVRTENQKKLQAVVESSVGAEKAKQAAAILGRGGLPESISALLRAKVEQAKVEQALPVLIKHQKQQVALLQKVEAKELTSEDVTAKLQELRTATAKDLAPIVGEEGAAAWQKVRAGGRGGARGGQRPGGQ